MRSVGVIGGGQLARMMQPAAINLGIQLKVFAETENSSAHQAATKVGDYFDYAQLAEFADGVDVITFDHEHVPRSLLEKLEASGVTVLPSSSALVHAQNKLIMRQRLSELGLPMPSWAAASSAQDIEDFIVQHGPKIIVKTPIGGYDGKGVRVVSAVSDVQDWLDNLASFGGQLLLEEKVDFRAEFAQLSARRPSGEFRTWPLARTVQHSSVCSEVIAPAGFPAQIEKATQIAQQIATQLNVVGVFAVELFETQTGQLLINELAMRPHNSGHFTQDGARTSQFEQHIRAVLDLPLGDTSMVSKFAVMINLLGQDDSNDFQASLSKAMSNAPEAKFHFYEKAPRAGRKMGHINLHGENPEALLEKGLLARSVLYGEG